MSEESVWGCEPVALESESPPTDRLLARSPEFARLWAAHDVAWRPGPDRKTFVHPQVGRVMLDCETL